MEDSKVLPALRLETIESISQGSYPLSFVQGDPGLCFVKELTSSSIILGLDCQADVNSQTIPRRHATELTYDAFVEEYMAPNLPVIIEGITAGWNSMRDWVTPDGEINIDALERLASSSQVCVTDSCRHHGGSGATTVMPFSDYAAWWRCNQAHSRASSTMNGSSGTCVPCEEATRKQQASRESSEPRESLGGGNCVPHSGAKLYLKDWHLVAEHPECHAYQLPVYFSEDWLNEYLDMKAGERTRAAESTSCSTSSRPYEESQTTLDGPSAVVTRDYRFVYLGPEGSFTALHADVFHSYSWSVNLCGRKRWLLLPPEHTRLLYDRWGRRCAPDFSLEGIEGADVTKFPGLSAARARAIEVIQGPGEALFVPSGWHHCVMNLEDTLSINHNWFNGYNIHWAMRHVLHAAKVVEADIADCRSTCGSEAEFDELVQRNLKAHCGVDLEELASLLQFIYVREMSACKAASEASATCRSTESGPLFGTNPQVILHPESGRGGHDLEVTTGASFKWQQHCLSAQRAGKFVCWGAESTSELRIYRILSSMPSPAIKIAS